jgi:HSP20 family protein
MTNLARFIKNEMEPYHLMEPIDLLFKNFFDRDSFFLPAINADLKYPVDIHETEKSLNIEVAVAGIDKKDIIIEEEDGILRISYDKQQEDNKEGKHYIQKSIAKRAFNFGWKIAEDKFDLKKIDAQMDKGILKIEIPKFEEDKKPAIIKNTIKIK